MHIFQLINCCLEVVIINIEKYPQYELYKFTKQMYFKKDKLIPKNCDNRCVYSTIINRCYYSSYLYASEWLEEKHNFKPLSKWEYGDDDFVTEHNQVIEKFRYLHLFKVNKYMWDLITLRKKADYEPFSPIRILN